MLSGHPLQKPSPRVLQLWKVQIVLIRESRGVRFILYLFFFIQFFSLRFRREPGDRGFQFVTLMRHYA